ncbi:MAG TPA: type II toxin-antitoxin system RelE/ParE family toxin [Tepidisphaeraceae bacterium]|jgi:plasmid stabilization system protein ParE
MTEYTVEFANEAWRAVEAQVRYIAVEKQAPENASRWLNRLLAAIETLEQIPRRFIVDPYQTQMHGIEVHRMVFERTYLVFYTVNDEQRCVNVVSFRHGRQKPPTPG